MGGKGKGGRGESGGYRGRPRDNKGKGGRGGGSRGGASSKGGYGKGGDNRNRGKGGYQGGRNGGGNASAGPSLISIMEKRLVTVRTRLAEGNLPNGPQLAGFMRSLVEESIPIAQRTKPSFVSTLKEGFRSIGWDADSNKALTSAPPAIRAVLTFLEKAVVKLKPAGAAPQAAKLPGTLTGVVEVKLSFVQTRLNEGKIPNGSQLRSFMISLVQGAWPLAQKGPARARDIFRNNLRSGIGWDAAGNKPASAKPPTAQELLLCLRNTLAQLKDDGYTPPAPAPAPAPAQAPAQAAGTHVTAAGVIIHSQQFNMEDYTTKLDKQKLTKEQIDFAERMAAEIENESRAGRESSGWDEGNSEMVSWE